MLYLKGSKASRCGHLGKNGTIAQNYLTDPNWQFDQYRHLLLVRGASFGEGMEDWCLERFIGYRLSVFGHGLGHLLGKGLVRPAGLEAAHDSPIAINATTITPNGLAERIKFDAVVPLPQTTKSTQEGSSVTRNYLCQYGQGHQKAAFASAMAIFGTFGAVRGADEN